MTILRKLIALLALVAFVSPMLSKLVIMVDFQLHRSYIIENLCVNRDEPTVMCYGQCVLSEKLSQYEQNNEVHFTSADQQEEVPQWYEEAFLHDTLRTVLPRPSRIFATRSRDHQSPVLPGVFHPPEVQADQL